MLPGTRRRGAAGSISVLKVDNGRLDAREAVFEDGVV